MTLWQSLDVNGTTKGVGRKVQIRIVTGTRRTVECKSRPIFRPSVTETSLWITYVLLYRLETLQGLVDNFRDQELEMVTEVELGSVIKPSYIIRG